jgi:hypothetical protein
MISVNNYVDVQANLLYTSRSTNQQALHMMQYVLTNDFIRSTLVFNIRNKQIGYV